MPSLRRTRIVVLDILQETQTIVILATALAILHLRNAHSVYFGLSTTCAALIAKVAKRFIRQPRPSATTKKTYGMPSTHSASIGFMATYLTLCCTYLQPHPRLHHIIHEDHWNHKERGFATVIVLFLSYLIWWSRVQLGHHTKQQVLAGASLGSCIALIAFPCWHGNEWTQSHTGIRLPWVSEDGWRIQGDKGERATEDLLFVCLEAWQEKSLETLGYGVATFVKAIFD